MELTTEAMKQFNDLNQRVFSSVRTSHPLYLNGSYRYSPWAGDIDLYCRVPLSELEKVLSILRGIDEGDDMLFHKLKVGEFKTYDKDLLEEPERVLGLLKRADKHRKWVKANWFLWTGSHVEEVSVVYDLGEPMTKAQVRKSIKADIAKYEAQPDLYKALKRRRLLAKNKKPYDAILNQTAVGLLYLCRVHAETIEKAKGHITADRIHKARGNLRQSVRVLLGIKGRITPENLLKIQNEQMVKISKRR